MSAPSTPVRGDLHEIITVGSRTNKREIQVRLDARPTGGRPPCALLYLTYPSEDGQGEVTRFIAGLPVRRACQLVTALQRAVECLDPEGHPAPPQPAQPAPARERRRHDDERPRQPGQPPATWLRVQRGDGGST